VLTDTLIASLKGKTDLREPCPVGDVRVKIHKY